MYLGASGDLRAETQALESLYSQSITARGRRGLGRASRDSDLLITDQPGLGRAGSRARVTARRPSDDSDRLPRAGGPSESGRPGGQGGASGCTRKSGWRWASWNPCHGITHHPHAIGVEGVPEHSSLAPSLARSLARSLAPSLPLSLPPPPPPFSRPAIAARPDPQGSPSSAPGP